MKTVVIALIVTANKKLYGCVVDMADNLVRKSDGKFDMQDYFEHPEKYASTFASEVSSYS